MASSWFVLILDCVLFRAQATYNSEHSKDTVQCIICNAITHLLRSAQTVCPHVVNRMAVNNGDCPHNQLNPGFHNVMCVYYEVTI